MPPRLLRILAPAALVLAVALVFHRAAGFGFVAWDDDIHIYENPHLAPSSLANLRSFWTEPYRKLYVPLTYTAWSAIAALSMRGARFDDSLRNHPGAFHTANVAMHAANALLAWLLLVVLLRAARPRGGAVFEQRILLASTAGALLFALHPLQVEPVAWTTGMKDLLSAGLSMAALLCYAASATRARPRTWYALAAATFALAMLAKPSAAIVPLVALCLDIGFLGRPWRLAARSALPLLALALPFAIVTKMAQPDAVTGAVPTLWQRLFVAGDAFAFYLGKLVLPVGLAPDHGRTPVLVLSRGSTYVLALVPALLAVALARFARTRRIGLAAYGAFVSCLLPVSGVIPFVHQAYSTVADRYAYLAMIGPALGLSALLSRLRGRTAMAAAAAAGLAIAAGGWLSFAQAEHWRSTEAIFTHTLAVNPSSWVSHNNLGHDLFLHGRFPEAAAHYEASLRILPSNGLARNNLGNIFLLSGKPAEAEKHYRLALGSADIRDRLDALSNLGLASEAQGRPGEAERDYREALALDEGYDKAQANLGNLLSRTGRPAEAVSHFERAMAANPMLTAARQGLAAALNDMGVEKRSAGEDRAAAELFRRAVGVWPASLTPQVNLGETLIAAGDVDGAIRTWIRALEAVPLSPELHHDLALAYLKKGDRKSAIGHLEEAIRIRPGFEPSTVLLAEISRAP
jgi:protein O-mannosyl-transferase